MGHTLRASIAPRPLAALLAACDLVLLLLFLAYLRVSRG